MSQKTFTVHVPLRWGDMDAYGHVNNVTMVRLLEEARIALFGLPPSSGEVPQDAEPTPIPLFADMSQGIQALVAEHAIKYRKPLAYRGLPVRVDLTIEKVSAASLTVSYRLFDPGTQDLCVTASTTLAFFDADAGTLVRLPADIRHRLTQHLAG